MGDRRNTFSTSTAAKKANVSIRQLYYWEQLGVIKPRYERFGLRQFSRYDKEDIDTLKRIRGLLSEGFTLKSAINKVKNSKLRKRTQGG